MAEYRDMNRDGFDPAEKGETTYVKTYSGRSYSDLPMEIILHIMGYLHPTDLNMASRTCHRWFEASCCPEFAERVQLDFSHCTLSDTTKPVIEFMDQVRIYTSAYINKVDFGDMSDRVWQRLNSIRSLTIRHCDLREKMFKSIVLPQRSLTKLTIDNCRELFMPGRLFEQDTQQIAEVFDTVTELALLHNRYLSDALLLRFISMMPRLTVIHLEGSHIAFHGGLYQKFYPKHKSEPSDSVLTFQFFEKIVQQMAGQLTGLNFSNTLLDGTSLERLASMERLRLNRIDLRHCDQLTNSAIINFVSVQTSLEHLDLTSVSRLADSGITEICNFLPELKSLTLRQCENISDKGVVELVRLKKLESLDLSECPSVGSRGICEGIGSVRNTNLTELRLSSLNICVLAVIALAENLPELRVLDLSLCLNGVTNLAMQWICRHLVRLRSLDVSTCQRPEYLTQVSDSGLTGINMVPTIRIFEMDKTKLPEELKVYHEFKGRTPDNPHLISLCSRAEATIVKEAKRKRYMMSILENKKDLAELGNCSGYSIDRLAGLRVLRMKNCSSVTDVSFKINFKLPELRELDLSGCHQITSLGIADLVRKCPSLERVDLTECFNASDKMVELIAVHLKRLRYLSLERCNSLTEHSLDHLAVNCEQLRYLNVQGCRLMFSEPSMRLVSIQSLRDVKQSRPGSNMQQPDKYFVPTPPNFARGYASYFNIYE